MCDQVQGYLLGRPMQMEGPTELVAVRARALVAASSRTTEIRPDEVRVAQQ